MINKIKYLFLSAICIGFIGEAVSVSAQIGKNKILVTRKSSLERSNVKKPLEFHERILDTELTVAEPRVTETFGGKEDRRNSDETMANLVQLSILNEKKQQQVCQLTISRYLDDLRRADTGKDLQFLLDTHKRIQRQR